MSDIDAVEGMDLGRRLPAGLKRVVAALGATAQARPSPRFAILIGLRYLLLAAGAYAIVTFTSLSLPAALTGLFVPVAAIMLEIIFELIYAP
jgi:hypothetical protein